MNRTLIKYIYRRQSINTKRTGISTDFCFLLAYRSSIQETTRRTPTIILFGRELRLLYELKYGSKWMKKINDLIYRIWRKSHGKLRFVHFITQGIMRKRWSQLIYHDEVDFLVGEEQLDLITVPTDYSLACFLARDLILNYGIFSEFRQEYGRYIE